LRSSRGTNRPFGEPLPRATNSEMHDRVVATGKPQISDLIMGAVLKRPILTVGVPVFRDGEVVYVLAMGLGPEMLSALMQDQKLSPDWTAAILDSRAASLFDGKISRRGNTCVRKISVILCPQSQRARNRKFADSLLEGRVTSELVSENLDL